LKIANLKSSICNSQSAAWQVSAPPGRSSFAAKLDLMTTTFEIQGLYFANTKRRNVPESRPTGKRREFWPLLLMIEAP
jgi:hypothetical protein